MGINDYKNNDRLIAKAVRDSHTKMKTPADFTSRVMEMIQEQHQDNFHVYIK